jgi:hypothetical protein
MLDARRTRVIGAGCLALVVIALTLGWLASRSRRPLLAIRNGIRPGMPQTEVMALVHSQMPARVQEAGDSVLVHEQGLGWILVIALEDGRAVAVCVRSYDSIVRRPSRAPADLVWEPEAAAEHPFCPGPVEPAR